MRPYEASKTVELWRRCGAGSGIEDRPLSFLTWPFSSGILATAALLMISYYVPAKGEGYFEHHAIQRSVP